MTKKSEHKNKPVKPRQIKRQSRWQAEQRETSLRFSPTAWAKLLYFRDRSENEIGGFGITHPDDLLFVRDFVTVKQEVTCVSVKFDDEAVADYFDAQVDLGRKPEQFGRIWLHSHPADSPVPSGTDEETFGRVFGNCEWAIMCIIAENDDTYARLSFNVGPGSEVLIPVEVDYSQEFGPTDHELWDTEYEANVTAIEWLSDFGDTSADQGKLDLSACALPYDFIGELEDMEPAERQFLLDELAEKPELWDEEEVLRI